MVIPSRAGNGPRKHPQGSKAMRPCRLEKTCRAEPQAVPKPTQVGGCKYTKARERNLVKELGNIAP